MVRLQLHLTTEQDRALRAAAKRRGTTRAALIRRGVDVFLAQARGARPDPLLDLVGQAGKLGDRRGSENIDKALYGSAKPALRLPRASEPTRRYRK
jgi:hypothetical protein